MVPQDLVESGGQKAFRSFSWEAWQIDQSIDCREMLFADVVSEGGKVAFQILRIRHCEIGQKRIEREIHAVNFEVGFPKRDASPILEDDFLSAGNFVAHDIDSGCRQGVPQNEIHKSL